MGNVKRRVDSISKSELDKCFYRGLVLNNEMKVFLISDVRADMSGASLSVCVGHLNSPPELQGLAHLCEHVACLRSVSSESDFVSYVNQCGGRFNGITTQDLTTFYFQVVPECLYKSLQKMSETIMSPAFTESQVRAEVNAINSEHENNILKDQFRLSNLVNFASKSNHPLRKFFTGNRMTLEVIPKGRNINVCKALRKFHATWYSSNIMSLCVLGRESLDDLQDMVVKFFGDIKNSNAVISRWYEHPYGPQQLAMKCYIVPVSTSQSLEMRFPIPDLSTFYKSSPEHYVSFLLNIRVPGSIRHLLHKKHFCSNLNAYARDVARGFGFFVIHIELTEEGLNEVDSVVKLVFQYINMLKTEGTKKWIFDELSKIRKYRLVNKQSEGLLLHLKRVSSNLHRYPMEDALTAGYHLDVWSPDLIQILLDYINADNVRLFITSQHFESKADRKDPWYGTRYKVEKIPEETIEAWKESGLHEDLTLNRNAIINSTQSYFIPRDKMKVSFPVTIKSTPIVRAWYKQDLSSRHQQTFLVMEFKLIDTTKQEPVACNMRTMFLELLQKDINDFEQSPRITEVHYTLKNTNSGIFLEMNGINSDILTFLKMMLESLRRLKVNREVFDILKEKLIKSWRNFENKHPHVLARYYMDHLLAIGQCTYREAEQVAEALQFNEFRSFVDNNVSQIFVELLLHGHVGKQTAKKLANLVEKNLTVLNGLPPIGPQPKQVNKEVKLPNDSNYLLEVRVKTCRNFAVCLYYQCPEQTSMSRMMILLMEQIMRQPFHSAMRMKAQLGYILSCKSVTYEENHGLMIIIQTDKSPKFVDQRVEAFLASMERYICNMTDTDFKICKESIATYKEIQFSHLEENTKLYWEEIQSEHYDFDREKINAVILRHLEKEDVLKSYRLWISPASNTRRKIAVHISSKFADNKTDSQSINDSEGAICKKPIRIHNINDFHNVL